MDYILAELSHIPAILLVIVNWSLRLIALATVPRNRQPMSGMAWLMLIFLSPILGWLAYIMFGNSKLPKHRRNLQARVDRYLESIDEGDSEARKVISGKYKSVVDLAESLVHMPVTYADRYEIIDEYGDVFKRLSQDINDAKEVINVSFYILGFDNSTKKLIKALADAHRRGVSVYVLYDDYSILRYRRWVRDALAYLKSAGIPVRASLPFSLSPTRYLRPDLRNHRKMVTIDHRICYTGSQNIIDKTYHRRDDIYYKELVVRMEGHVAKHLEIVFATDWLAETKENILLFDPSPRRHNKQTNLRVHVLPSGPGYSDENNLKVFTALFYTAERSITIVNPYFVPDSALMTAIISAARRGVRVTMINSEAVDQFFVAHAQRSYYDQLLEAGVHIYLHRKPALVHSKFIIIDDEVSTVGSSNMDMRSFMLDSELTVMVYGEQFASGLQAVADAYLANAKNIDKESWGARPAAHKIFDTVARLTASIQ